MSGYFCTSSRLIIATSRAVVWWLSSSISPQQSVKCVFVIPNDCAFSFIFVTKASSLPQMYSAIATAASLPLATAIHLISVSTVCTSPASRNTCEPPIDCACSLVTTSSVRWICPCPSASKISSSVIILVILAGEQIRSASFSKITVPVCASSKMAEGADTVTAPSAAVPSSPGTRDAIKISRNDSHAAKTFFQKDCLISYTPSIRFTTIFMSLLPDYSFFAYFCAIAAAAAAATVSAGTTAPVAVSIVTPVAGSVTHVAGLITGTAVARPFASNT